MHRVLHRVLSEMVFRDTRVPSMSRLVYLGMRSHRKTNVKGYADALAMPYQTVHGAIQRLERCGWAYRWEAPWSPYDIRVPWMPADVESALANELVRLADTAPNRGEFLMKAMLDVMVDDGHFVDNHRPPWATSIDGTVSYEFDRAYPAARVAIEFQGRQHFETVQFRHGQSNLQEQMARDRAKMLACQRKGFAHVEIPDVELSWEALRERLDGLLPVVEPPKGRPLYEVTADLCYKYVQWARRRRETG